MILYYQMCLTEVLWLVIAAEKRVSIIELMIELR